MLLRQHIKYERDNLLSDFSKATLTDRYLKSWENSPQELYMRASTAWGSNKEHSLRLYEYASLGWFGFASPTISNAPVRTHYLSDHIKNFTAQCFESVHGALPISCFTGYVGDSREEIAFHYQEMVWLASNGGGYKAFWNVRPIGSKTSTGSKTGGLIPFYHVTDGLIIATHQGNDRRGIYGGAVSVSHVEILEFIQSRKMSGDNNKRSRNVFQTVTVPDSFMYALIKNEFWELKDHNGNVKRRIRARYLWEMILSLPFEVGCPFILFEDNAQAGLPQAQKDLGLRVHNPNICTEITLATDKDRTAVCVLCSPNAAKYDEWKDHPHFIADLTEMLDNIIEYFIQNAIYACTKDYDWDKLKQTIRDTFKNQLNIDFTEETVEALAKNVVEKNIMGYKKAVYSASRERAIGIGLMGLDSYFMNNDIAYESNEALSITEDIFRNIKTNHVKATKALALKRGEAPDMKGTGYRNSHGLAVAPTATNSIIVNVTAAMEKRYQMRYPQKTKTGTFPVEEPNLKRILDQYGLYDSQTLKSIDDHDGSVQHLKQLSQHHRNILKTAFEIDQRWVVEHAAVAQKYVCQAISVNLFLEADVTKKYVNNLHFLMWKRGLKTRYYVRCRAAASGNAFADDLIEKYNGIDYNIDFNECVSCHA